MNTNPLLSSGSDAADNRNPDGYLLQRQEKTIQPARAHASTNANQAADLIRDKLKRIYAEEPDPLAEEKQAEETIKPRSKHQQYMVDLSTSGKSLAEIQTAWHAYYAALSDAEKHEVWREFYAANGKQEQPTIHPHTQQTESHAIVRPTHEALPRSRSVYMHHRPEAPKEQSVTVSSALSLPTLPDKRSPAKIRKVIRDKVTAGGKLKIKHHVQSLLFGLSIGVVTLVVFLFGFFNEVIIAPFIQPSRNVGATPIIVDPSSITPSSTPEIIIPKIHLEIPIDYSQTSTNENTIENALENGIVHYPSTVVPGQNGNAAFFGHSSNNIFNPGKYKFAFVLLHELVPGDTFYITYGGKVYIYKVFDKKIVDPSDVNVLNNVSGHTATATLITCDPPGTSLHRLVVTGDQISPDPSANTSDTNTSAPTITTQSSQLPGNGPTLLSRLWHAIF